MATSIPNTGHFWTVERMGEILGTLVPTASSFESEYKRQKEEEKYE